MKPKNYGELTEGIFNEIEKNLDELKEIAVGDSLNPATVIIKADLKTLIFHAIVGRLAENGVVKGNGLSDDEKFQKGVAINLEDVVIDFKGGRLMVYTQRDRGLSERFAEDMKEFTKGD